MLTGRGLSSSSLHYSDYVSLVAVITVAALAESFLVCISLSHLTVQRFFFLPYFRPAAERAQAGSDSGVGQDGGGMGQFRDSAAFTAGVGFFPSLFGLQFVSSSSAFTLFFVVNIDIL